MPKVFQQSHLRKHMRFSFLCNTHCGLTILIDPLDYGMTFELPIALSIKSLDDIDLDVNRHICNAHFYMTKSDCTIVISSEFHD